MKHLSLLLLCAASLSAAAQSPFDEQTKAVYVFNVSQNKMLTDYQAPTPKTFALRDYGASWRDFMLFEMTTLNPATGQSVLYSTYTGQYMSVPANGIVNTCDIDSRTILTVEPSEGGHSLIKAGESIVTIMKSGYFHTLVSYNPATFDAWGTMEESLWDFVEPEALDDYLLAHGIDPASDPYAEDPDPDPDPDPQPTATMEELQYVINRGMEMLRSVETGIVPAGDPLITSEEQFRSDFSDAEEGTSFQALIDGDLYTFWHSDWHGTAPRELHSFSVSLPEGCRSLQFIAQYTGRLEGNNCAPVEMNVYGGHKADPSLELPGNVAWEAAPFACLTQEDGIGAFGGWGHSADADALSGQFVLNLDDYYDALLFEPSLVLSDAGYGVDSCFAYSEFQLYRTAIDPAHTDNYDREAAAVLRDLLNEARSLTPDADPAEMIEYLEQAMAALAPEGISRPALRDAASAAPICDLQGRPLPAARVPSGLYIKGGTLSIGGR